MLMANEKLSNLTIRLTGEQVEKLNEVAEKRFRGASKNKVMVFLIEDAWKEETENANRETS